MYICLQFDMLGTSNYWMDVSILPVTLQMTALRHVRLGVHLVINESLTNVVERLQSVLSVWLLSVYNNMSFNTLDIFNNPTAFHIIRAASTAIRSPVQGKVIQGHEVSADK